MSLVSVALASGDASNPIISGLDAVSLVQVAAQGPAALVAYVNPTLTQLEANQPEGQRMELDLTGLVSTAFGVQLYNWAPNIVGTLNAQFAAGNIRDVTTGEAVQAWPEYPGQIAWVAGTGAVTIRWVKGQPFVGWIIAGLLVAALAYALYVALRNSGWNLSKAISQLNPTNPHSTTGSITIFGIPLAWWLAGAAAAVVIPFGEERLAVYERARRALTRSGS